MMARLITVTLGVKSRVSVAYFRGPEGTEIHSESRSKLNDLKNFADSDTENKLNNVGCC
jgi:hypothetical protein